MTVGGGAVARVLAALLTCALVGKGVSPADAGPPPLPGASQPALFAELQPGCRPSIPTARPLISTFFVAPRPTREENRVLLRTSCSDAVTFGDRVVPSSREELPSQVAALVPPGRRVFRYRGGARLDPRALAAQDRQVVLRGVTWTVVQATGSGVVVASDATGDGAGSLAAAGDDEGRRVLLGLPRPQQDPARPYLPDLTYQDVVVAFAGRYVRDGRLDGADGFYQTVEVPVGGSASVWGGVLAFYRAEHAAVARAAAHATVLVAPYVESRRGRAWVSPSRAAVGAREIAATAAGTDLVLAPQDGLGTGTTALRRDGSPNHVAATEDYLAAMQRGAGGSMCVTVEVMRPTLAGRAPTTRARVAQQVAAAAPYADCLVGFIWEDTSRGIGAARVPGGIGDLQASSP